MYVDSGLKSRTLNMTMQSASLDLSIIPAVVADSGKGPGECEAIESVS